MMLRSRDNRIKIKPIFISLLLVFLGAFFLVNPAYAQGQEEYSVLDSQEQLERFFNTERNTREEYLQYNRDLTNLQFTIEDEIATLEDIRESGGELTPEEAERLAELESSRDQLEQNIADSRRDMANVRRDTINTANQAAVDIREMNGTCSFGPSFTIQACIAEGLSWLVWIASYLLWAAGWLLNWSIEQSIINFKALAELSFITESWKIIRDLANISFIFILLYIAISTILQINAGESKKLLTYVIIVALLVNFSAVLTRTVIDISNVVSVSFYNNIGTESPPDISTIFVKGAGVRYFSGAEPADAPGGLRGGDTNGQIIINALGDLALMTVTIFVLLAAGILFIIRTLILLLLIILAPLAFLGFALPKFGKNISGKWTTELTNQAIFAPVFMIMLFVTLKVTDSRAELLSHDGPGGNGFIIYIFLIGFMLASILIASKLGARGGSWANKIAVGGSKATGRFASTQTLGRAANAVAESKLAKSAASKSPRIAGTLRSTLQKGANLKFGGKAGYADQVKARQERRQETLKSLSADQQATYLKNLPGGLGRLTGGTDDQKKIYKEMSDREKVDRELKARADGNTELADALKGLREGLSGEKKDSVNKIMGEQLRNEYNKTTGTPEEKDKQGKVITPAQTAEEKRRENFIKLDNEDRKLLYNALKNSDRAKLEQEVSASGNTEVINQITELKNNLSLEDQNKIKEEAGKLNKGQSVESATKQIKDILTQSPVNTANLSTQLDNLTSKQIAALDESILKEKEVAKLLKRDDVAAVQRSESISRGAKTKIYNEIRANGDPEARAYLATIPYGVARRQNGNNNPPPESGPTITPGSKYGPINPPNN